MDVRRFRLRRLAMTIPAARFLTVIALLAGAATAAAAQQPEPATREAAIVQEQAQKVPTLKPYVETRGEKLANRAESILAGAGHGFHPFFQNAYSGGGFTLGAGYLQYISPYNTLDARGSYTISGYKRAEVAFNMRRLFD